MASTHEEKHVKDKGNSVAAYVAAYLADRPVYEFEILAQETERLSWRGKLLTTEQIAQSWEQVSRYGAGPSPDLDEDRRSVAIDRLDARGLLGGASGGLSGYSISGGVMRDAANLRSFSGLNEGLQRLRSS